MTLLISFVIWLAACGLGVFAVLVASPYKRWEPLDERPWQTRFEISALIIAAFAVTLGVLAGLVLSR